MIRVVLDAEADQDGPEDETGESQQPEREARPDEDDREPRCSPDRERDDGLRVELQMPSESRPAGGQIELDLSTGLEDEVAAVVERQLARRRVHVWTTLAGIPATRRLSSAGRPAAADESQHP